MKFLIGRGGGRRVGTLNKTMANWCLSRNGLIMLVMGFGLGALLFHQAPTQPVPRKGRYVKPRHSVIVAEAAAERNIKSAYMSTSTISPVENNTSDTVIEDCPAHFKGLTSTLLYATYNNLPQKSLHNRDVTPRHNRTVLILSPISNSVHNLHHYFSLVCSLMYPHHLLSVVLGEDGSQDDTLKVAQSYADQLNGKYLRRARVMHFDEKLNVAPKKHKHDQDFQFSRRSHLAVSRNRLLFAGLRDEDYVLWLDSDVSFIPPDIIDHLMSADQDLVVPTCMCCLGPAPTYNMGLYDRNSWQETPTSLDHLENMSPEKLMLEGYASTKRKFLSHLVDKGLSVPLDGVGGCVILIKADQHRRGLVFPTFVFDHHIETEGLAKMAKKMNATVYGLPSVTVIHH